MSDFLSRLADRALGKDAPVSPRLRSRFEPERMVSGAGLGWAEASSQRAEGMPADVTPAVGTPAGREPYLDAGGAGLRRPAPPASGVRRAVTARQASEPRDDRARGPAPTAAPPVRAPAFPGVPAGESAVHLPSHPDRTDAPDTPGAGQRAATRLDPPSTGAGRPPGERSRARVRAAHPGEHPVGGIEPPPSARLVLRDDAWAVLAGPGAQPAGAPSPGGEMAGRTYEVLAARVLGPHDRNRALQNPDPEPVINITIGRIDVRAAPPPEAERRGRPASRGGPEPLGLNEYLRRREQGR